MSVFRPLLKKGTVISCRAGDTGKVACDNMACRWIQKWRVRTRARRLNRTPNIGIRRDLVVVENDISNRFFVLITNKKRVKILEILWDIRGDSVISEYVGNIK